MAKKNLYSRFDVDSLILRDELAIDRTLLANERTLLSYLRSGIALLIAGISFIHFASSTWLAVVGFLCLPSGFLTILVGLLRYAKMDKAISVVRRVFKVSLASDKTSAEVTHPGHKRQP
ncbi:MAG: DUF202 domain-containing protein [Sulfuricaulis sp.]